MLTRLLRALTLATLLNKESAQLSRSHEAERTTCNSSHWGWLPCEACCVRVVITTNCGSFRCSLKQRTPHSLFHTLWEEWFGGKDGFFLGWVGCFQTLAGPPKVIHPTISTHSLLVFSFTFNRKFDKILARLPGTEAWREGGNIAWSPQRKQMATCEAEVLAAALITSETAVAAVWRAPRRGHERESSQSEGADFLQPARISL